MDTPFVADGVGEAPLKLLKVPGPPGIARRRQQIAVGAEAAADVAAGFGQQRLEHSLGSSLMEPVLGVGGFGGERIFQERDAHALGAADFFERRRGPGPAFDHLREQRQADADHLVVLGQAGYRASQKLFLFLAGFLDAFGKLAEGTPQGG
jgi:hypothetical protein